jgi:hypothetical protein
MNKTLFTAISLAVFGFQAVAQPFGSAAEENQRLKSFSSNLAELRAISDELAADIKSQFVENRSGGITNQQARRLSEQADIINGYSTQFEDILGASNVLFSVVAISMAVDGESRSSYVPFYLNSVCLNMPGSHRVSSRSALESIRSKLEQSDKASLTAKQFKLINDGLKSAAELKSSYDALCARAKDSKNWVQSQ